MSKQALTRNEVLKDYSQKIYGFAYSKLKNTFDAEDLSSEIILNLCEKKWETIEVEFADAYIYKICQYTWSKYLRKHKKNWQTLNNASLDDLKREDDLCDGLISREEKEKLHQEILQLSKLKREIIMDHYFKERTSQEISQTLKMTSSTVRWHLLQTKKELKMRMESHDKIHQAVHMWFGYYGWCENDLYKQLESNRLLQNICYICKDKALSIEEMSRKLGVAAVYFEDYLSQLVELEYMLQKKDKYQSNFFIQDVNYYRAHDTFLYEHLRDFSLDLYKAVSDHMPAIQSIGFTQSTMAEGKLLWYLLPRIIMKTVDHLQGIMMEEENLSFQLPKRVDGTEHFIAAGLYRPDALETLKAEDPKLFEYCQVARESGIKYRTNKIMSMVQFDISLAGGFRAFAVEELMLLHKVKHQTSDLNAYEKEQIGHLIEAGYLSHSDTIEFEIPYFTKTEMVSFDLIIDKFVKEMTHHVSLFTAYANYIKDFLPKHLSKNEINHYKATLEPHYGILYWLLKEGILLNPSEIEKKSICTLVWEL